MSLVSKKQQQIYIIKTHNFGETNYGVIKNVAILREVCEGEEIVRLN